MLIKKAVTVPVLYVVQGEWLGWHRKISWLPFEVDIKSDKMSEGYGHIAYDISDVLDMPDLVGVD